MKILQLGYGNMGRALLDRWRQALSCQFTVIDPAGEPVAEGAFRLARSLDGVAEKDFDALIVAVKPQIVDTAVAPAKDRLADRAFVISIAAGAAISQFEDLLGPRPVIRMMPNLPVVIGKGMAALTANRQCSEKDREFASALAATAGEYIWVDTEDQIDRFTALAGSGPGYIFELARNFADAAIALGFDQADARKLVLQTMIGAAEMAMASDQSLEALREAVTSPQGTTDAGLKVLRRDGAVEALFTELTRAAYDRAVELRGDT